MPQAADLRYSDIEVGSVSSFERVLTEKDMEAFSELSGNWTPLHADPEFGKQSRYGGIVIHGMLAASLFSTLLGMHCPGRRGICLSHTLNFSRPIFPGRRLLVKGTVVGKSDVPRVVKVWTEIIVEGEIAVTGEAYTVVTD